MGRGNVKVSIQSAFDDKGVRKAETSLDHLNTHAKRSFGEATKHALGYGAALIGGAGIVGGLEAVAHASIEAGTAQAKLDTQLKAVGISYTDHSKQIQDVLEKTSAYSGFLDKDLEGALSNIVRSTGDLGKSLKLLGLATDIARTKNIDVASAGALIGKVYAGNTRVLKSLGLQLDPVTKAHDKLAASTKHATDEQKRAATAEDKRATAQKAIALLQGKLSGQAAAYGKTTAGSLDKMKAAVDRLEVRLGNALAPTIQKVATAVAKFVTQMQTGQGAGGRFARSMDNLWQSIKPVLQAAKDIVGWLAKHPALLKAAAAAWLGYKAATLLAIGATKLALLSTFGPGMRAKLAGEAAVTGKVSGTALASKMGVWVAAGIAAWELSSWLEKKINGSIADTVNNITSGGQSSLSDVIANKLGINQHQDTIGPGFGNTVKNLGRKFTPKTTPKRPAHGTSFGNTGIAAHTSSVMASASSAGPTAHASRTFSHGELMRLWVAAGGSPAVADLAAAIAQAESGGNQFAHNPSGASGLWQILGQVVGGNIYDPMVNARNAVKKWRDAGGFSPWTVYTGYDTPGHAKTYVQYLTGAKGPSGGGGGTSGGATAARPAPKPKATAFDKLQNRLDYIDLQEQAGVISEGTGDQAIVNAVKRALPHLSGADRLRALAARREAQQRQRERQQAAAQTQRQQAAAGRQARTVNRTIDNPWLQAYLTHQDYLAASGGLTQDQANANKTAALRGALPGLRSEADKTTALGMIADLQPAPADTTGATSDNTDSIDANTRALEQTNALLQQQIDVEKDRSVQLERALAVAQSEERTLGRSLANQLGITFGIRAGMNKLLPTVGASQ